MHDILTQELMREAEREMERCRAARRARLGWAERPSARRSVLGGWVRRLADGWRGRQGREQAPARPPHAREELTSPSALPRP